MSHHYLCCIFDASGPCRSIHVDVKLTWGHTAVWGRVALLGVEVMVACMQGGTCAWVSLDRSQSSRSQRQILSSGLLGVLNGRAGGHVGEGLRDVRQEIR